MANANSGAKGSNKAISAKLRQRGVGDFIRVEIIIQSRRALATRIVFLAPQVRNLLPSAQKQVSAHQGEKSA